MTVFQFDSICFFFDILFFNLFLIGGRGYELSYILLMAEGRAGPRDSERNTARLGRSPSWGLLCLWTSSSVSQ